MIRIAICDDEKEIGERIFQFTQKHFEQTNVVGTCCVFDSGQKLLYEVEETKTWFDILLLDIEMPKLDGMELTLRVREYLLDVIVIFITSYEKYIYHSFKVQPYRFIPKDKVNEMLPEALNDAITTINAQEGKFYLAENKDIVEKIFYKNIIYIWRIGKYCYIQKTNGESTKVRATLKEIYKELDNDMFEWIDRGYICNLAHIVKITDDTIELTNGEKLQVSGDRLTSVKNQLRDYLTKKG